MAETTSAVETPKDFGDTDEGKVKRWLAEIAAYDSKFESWKERCPKIVKRYRDEEEMATTLTEASGRYNILWSNIQTLQPALYSRLPKADVSRRYKDRDPIARAASEILERSIEVGIERYDFSGTVKGVRDDYLLCARGQGWVRYVPHYGEETTDRIPLTADDTGKWRDDEGEVYDEAEEDDDGTYAMTDPYRPVEYEEVICDYINWADFGHSPAPTWEKVGAVWKKELLTRKQLVERFGPDKGRQVTLEKVVTGIADDVKEAFGDVFKRAEVYEIWDRDQMKAIWISPGYKDGPLDELEDPLRLEGFFPCPKPFYGTTTTDTLVPVPDYAEYQSQASELDRLSERIKILTAALKVAGVYAGAKDTMLEGLLSGSDNVMIPVANWAMFAEQGGLDKMVSWFPVEQVAAVLTQLVQMREQVKREVAELTGMSDIVRGQGTDAGGAKTATEQRIKSQYAALRLKDRQAELQRWIRDILRLKGEIIAEHFDPKTIAEMSGWFESPDAKAIADKRAKAEQAVLEQMQQQAPGQMPPPPPELPPTPEDVFQKAVALLRDDRLRSFRIEIETDSTVFEDQEAEKEARTQFLGAVSGFLREAVPAAQQSPALGPLLGEMLLFTVRGWKTGRQMEATIEQGLEDLRNTPPPQQGPSEAEIQAKTDQARAAVDQEKAKNDGLRLQIDQQKLTIEQQRAQAESDHRAQEALADEAARQHLRDIERWKLDIAQTEAEARLEEIKMRPVQADRQYELENAKFEDGKAARQEQRNFETERSQAERGYAVEDRDADGRTVTDDLEDEMKAVAEALLQIAAAMKEQGDEQQKRHEEMMKTMTTAMTAPRVLERDKAGKAFRTRIEMPTETVQ